MLTTLPPAQLESEKKDKGFTLIELLVVVVIIGVLAAIAIPIFLNQKDKAAEAGVKSDIKNASTYLETFYVDAGTYDGAGTYLAAPTTDFKASAGNAITVPTATANAYCIQGVGTTGAIFHLTSEDGAVVPAACP